MVTPLPRQTAEPVPKRRRPDRRTVAVILGFVLVAVVAGSTGWKLRDRRTDPSAVPVGHLADFPIGSATALEFDIGHYDPFGAEGSSDNAAGPGEVPMTRLFIVNDATQGLIALSQRSPWLGCRLVEVTASGVADAGYSLPEEFEHGFSDPCHGGLFAFDGRHLAGPGEWDMRRFPIGVYPDGTVEVDLTRLEPATSTALPPVVATSPSSTTSTTTSSPYEEVFSFVSSMDCEPTADDADVQVVQAFFAAYNQRDMARLHDLIETDEIWDPGGISRSGRVLWNDVAGWATSGWDSGEQFELVRVVRYGPQAGSDITLIRTGDALVAAGIDSLVVGFKVPSSECTIHRLVGDVSPNVRSNCAFFTAYLDDLSAAVDQNWTVPTICDE